MAKQYRDFEEVVKQIARSEEDVDKVLEAARLIRQERSSFWEGTGFLEIIFGAVCLLEVGGMIAFMILTII